MLLCVCLQVCARRSHVGLVGRPAPLHTSFPCYFQVHRRLPCTLCRCAYVGPWSPLACTLFNCCCCVLCQPVPGLLGFTRIMSCICLLVIDCLFVCYSSRDLPCLRSWLRSFSLGSYEWRLKRTYMSEATSDGIRTPTLILIVPLSISGRGLEHAHAQDVFQIIVSDQHRQRAPMRCCWQLGGRTKGSASLQPCAASCQMQPSGIHHQQIPPVCQPPC